MALQVHDELVIDGRVEIPKAVEEVAPFKTPIKVKELVRWE